MRLEAAVLAAVLPLTMATPVGAAPAPGRPHHDLKVNAKELDSADRFLLYGKVPTFPRGRIVVTRSVAGGTFHPVKRIPTSANGRFRTRIFQVPGRLTCFKVVVPATRDYRRTTSRGASCIKS